MVEEMKDYIIRYSLDEENVLKMAEDVVRTYKLSENKQKLIVRILDYCGVGISEEDDILRNARIDCCIGSIEDISYYLMKYNGIYLNDNLKEMLEFGFDFEKFINSTYSNGFVIFELNEDIFGIVAESDL